MPIIILEQHLPGFAPDTSWLTGGYMDYIPAKTLIARMPPDSGWFGCDYNMNIYKGCCHGCIYCDSRSECYHVDNFDEVRAKKDALVIMERELKTKRQTGVVGVGAMSDPYNPFESEHKLTRGALELINRYGFGINMLTKSDLVTRDIDLYQEIQRHSPVSVRLTITTFDDSLCRKLEPRVAVTSKRFAAIQELAQAGIYTGVLLMPVLPFINDTEENITGIVQEAHQSGAKFIYPAFGVTLRQNQRAYFYGELPKMFPGVKERYIKMFGASYECPSPNARRLWEIFTTLCARYGILYQMTDIVAGYKNQMTTGQMKLF